MLIKSADYSILLFPVFSPVVPVNLLIIPANTCRMIIPQAVITVVQHNVVQYFAVILKHIINK